MKIGAKIYWVRGEDHRGKDRVLCYYRGRSRGGGNVFVAFNPTSEIHNLTVALEDCEFKDGSCLEDALYPSSTRP